MTISGPAGITRGFMTVASVATGRLSLNMDGTALYRAVAAVYVAQAIVIVPCFGAQLEIVPPAVVASNGKAAMPSAAP